MRERLVAWAEDCVLRGEVELPDGRLSDAVNERDLIRFEHVSLEALDDGRILEADELEVERRDLHLIEVHGHEGDPVRRLRTVPERVAMEVGPFLVKGNLHRAPNAASLAALTRWVKFVPVTDAVFALREGGTERSEGVILVNRERIARADLEDVVRPPDEEPWESAAVTAADRSQTARPG